MTPKQEAEKMYNSFKEKLNLPWFFKDRFIKRSCYNVIDETLTLALRKERLEYWQKVRDEIKLIKYVKELTQKVLKK